MAHESHTKTLPADLSAPAFVDGWRRKAVLVGGIFSVVAALLAFADGSVNHFLRAWVLGLMLTFGWSVGGLAMLMVQYCSGGKWGLLLRRPLEAMSRTLPLVFVYWVVVALQMKRLYLWAAVSDVQAALKSGFINETQAHCIEFKRAMLNPAAFVIVGVICFAIWAFYSWRLNDLALRRDSESPDTTPFWIKKLENISGPGIVVYSLTMTAAVIYWVMSMDVTWFSSVYGLLFLVGQGYSVLAFSIIVAISLSKAEPFKTILRQTEQHDLGKLTFAFVMLNIYLTFAEFLIIWSGNLPDEIPWYLARIHGGWWTICSLDFIAHWLIPFCLLLSRDLKRNKTRMIWITCWMLFARVVDMFWLVEPNFKGAAGNLVGEPLSVLAYITVPATLLSLWVAYYLTQLMKRPLVVINDPHLEEILEPEHAH